MIMAATVYETYYKKGHTMHWIRFAHSGDLDSAVAKVRNWLQRRNLKHIHTVKFLADLDNDRFHDDESGLEEIDIEKDPE